MPKINPNIHITTQVEKLLEQIRAHGSLVIGVDFDDTLYNRELDEPNEDMVDLVQRAKKAGHTICIWTANINEELVKTFCVDNSVEYDHYNDSPIAKTGARKAHFNLLLDDSAGLGYAITILETILWLTREE